MLVNNCFYYLPMAEESKYRRSLELSASPFSQTFLDYSRDLDQANYIQRNNSPTNKVTFLHTYKQVK